MPKDSGSGGGASSSREVPGRAGEANEEQRPYSSSFSVTGGGLARGRRKTAVRVNVSICVSLPTEIVELAKNILLCQRTFEIVFLPLR